MYWLEKLVILQWLPIQSRQMLKTHERGVSGICIKENRCINTKQQIPLMKTEMKMYISWHYFLSKYPSPLT